MTRPRRIAAATVALALILGVSTAPPVLAGHAAFCQDGPGQVNRWLGHELSGQRHGVAAVIEAMELHQCTWEVPGVEISGSFVWVNIEGRHFNDIVQVGVGKCRYPMHPDCTWEMEINGAWGRHSSTAGCEGRSNVDPVARIRADYNGTSYNYKVYHQSNAWRLFVGNTQVQSIAESEICWPISGATWFGETLDKGDAFGGTRGNKLNVTGMNYANSENGTFYWTNWNVYNSCSMIPNNPMFFCDIDTSRSIALWTER